MSVGQSRLGPILVDRAGRTLYMFASDKPNASACVAACARVWPPAAAPAHATAGAGVAADAMGKIRRADDTLQLTYHSHPLYTFSGDSGRGQLGGEGFLGTWFVVSPAGARVVDPRAPVQHAGY